MNIGQLPPFFIWPYALYLILTRRSLFLMLETLLAEQEKYYMFYDSMKQTLETTADRALDMYQNYVEGDGYGVAVFLKNTVLLFFGGIFLVMLKMYILFRHFNYVIFVILLYWTRLQFGLHQNVVHENEENLHEHD